MLNINEWHDISKIEEFRDHYEFCNYAVLVGDIDEDGDHGDYEDMAFGIALFPKGVKRFFCIPNDEGKD